MAEKKQTKEYGVYYWDTFDDETLFLKEFDDFQEACHYVEQRYEGRIRHSGADKVDIVDRQGNVVKQYSVG